MPKLGIRSLAVMGILSVCCSAAFGQGEINSTFIPGASEPGVVVFTAKKIITMEKENPEATAVAVSGKRILFAGSLDQVKQALSSTPYRVDKTFAAKVIMPGFIDQHLHPILGALTLTVEVIAPEDWVLPDKTYKRAATPQEYMARLKAANTAMKDPNEWLFTWGYHQYWHGAIDKKALDSISSTRPIAVWHRSCHEFYLNSAALQALGITQESVKGKGQASEQSDFAKGYFYEGGLNLIMPTLIPKLGTPQRFAAGLHQMVEMLHQNGVTAYNEPGALVTPAVWKLYQQILGADDVPFYSFFIADGRGIVDKYGLEGALAETEKTIALAPPGTGKLQFFDKQVKLFADGAIISQLMQMKDGYTDGHHGAWIIPPEELQKRATLYWNAGYQLHIHVNGDEGLEVVLNILDKLMRDNPRADSRTVIVHFANSTESQVGRIARLGALVSSNPYYVTGFSDKYAEIGLGPQRADAMVRSGSVV